MDGSTGSPNHSSIYVRAVTAVAGLLATILLAVTAPSSAGTEVHRATVTLRDIGPVPSDFEVPEPKDPAHASWSVVRDVSSEHQLVFEQSSHDLPDDVFPMVVYRPLSLKNLDVHVHFKIVGGR